MINSANLYLVIGLVMQLTSMYLLKFSTADAELGSKAIIFFLAASLLTIKHVLNFLMLREKNLSDVFFFNALAIPGGALIGIVFFNEFFSVLNYLGLILVIAGVFHFLNVQ